MMKWPIVVWSRMRRWIKVGPDFGRNGPKGRKMGQGIEVVQGCPAEEFRLLALDRLVPLLEVWLSEVPLLLKVPLEEPPLLEVPLEEALGAGL